MKLDKLLKNLEIVKVVGQTEGVEIKGIYIDSRKIEEGGMFVCIKGTDVDGHDYVDLCKNKPAAILTQKEIKTDILQIIVKNTRKAIAIVASNFYSNPEKKLKIIGVTGTNGKTSVTYFLKHILESSGKKVGVIGTLGAKIYDAEYDIGLTTPDSLTLYGLFAEMVKKNIEYAVMEVSAHALDLMRVEGITFKIAVFTNFTQDHLDYFGSMENYKQAKLKLFDTAKSEYAVVNIDDEVGREIASMRDKVITYGLDNPSDSFAIDIAESIDGLKFVMNVMDCIYDADTKLMGKFNIYNLLAAVTVSALLGIKHDDIASSLKDIGIVSGRMECVGKKGEASIFIDYAHTPDGLQNILESAKHVTEGKLVCLFGCGGNRDKSKRPIMGEISGKYSDFTILTSDNPRYEDPMLIINDVESGLRKQTSSYVIIQNREQALKYAVEYISGNDTLVVCGKGAETYQEVLGVKHPFNDKKIIMNLLEK